METDPCPDCRGGDILVSPQGACRTCNGSETVRYERKTEKKEKDDE